MRQKTEEELAIQTEHRRRTIINFIYFGIFFALSVVIVRYALRPLLPFIIAYIVTVILNPLVKVCERKLKMDRKRCSVILVLIFYATIGVTAVLLLIAVADWAMDIVRKLPSLYRENIYPALKNAVNAISDFIARIDSDGSIDVDGTLGDAVSKITSMITDVSASIISKAPSMALSFTSVLLNTIIAIISTAFLLMDYEMITSFVHHQLPEKKSDFIKQSTSHLGQVLKKYIISYALIMLITFAEIFLGLSIIGVEGAFAIAILVAVFDILPIVGSGMIMFPWAVIELILGHFGRGIGLMIIWAFVVIMRQIIEPKIVGNTVGIHPFLTLFAMLAGNFIYGGIGVLLLPVTLALVQSLNQAKIIHIYSRVKQEDREKVKDGPLTLWFNRLLMKIWAWTKKLFEAFFGWLKSKFGKNKDK